MLTEQQKKILTAVFKSEALTELSEHPNFDVDYEYLDKLGAIEGVKPESDGEPYRYTTITGYGISLIQ